MPKAKFSIIVVQISLFSLLGLLVAENTVAAEGRRSECQTHHHLMSPWPQCARHVERTELLSAVTEHHAQISPFPVLHVSHMLCVGGGGGQIPGVHAFCGYGGIYGMLQSTDEVNASSWSWNSISSMLTLPSGIVDD